MSSNLNSQLILDLDTTLRNVLQQPTIDNIHLCFSLIKQCYSRRIEDEKIVTDDSLYIPSILILRQFNRFQSPSLFDKLLEEFISLFKLLPICTKKILDDFLCIISIIFTKRIMITNDEVQQNLFIQFFRSFCLSIKSNSIFFYKEFLGNFNDNLPIIGHYISCLLQLYEKLTTLDYRLNIIDTIWSLFLIDKKNENENEYQLIVGQILACFLPGILKTFIQDINLNHQRLIQSNLILLSYIIRLTINHSPKYFNDINSIKIQLRDLIVERNEQWLAIVDSHIAPLLQRLTTNYVNHENIYVRRALGILMLTILCYCSIWLKISSNIALKTMLVLISSTEKNSNEIIVLKILLEKLFKLPMESVPVITSYIPYENEFINEILNSSELILSDHLLIECQSDLFKLLNDKQISSSSILNDRQWHLQLFIGYYTFIHQHIQFLFNIETFTEKLFHFIFNTIDLDLLIKNNINLLNESSLSINDKQLFDKIQYNSIYKYFKADVHNEIEQIIELFLISNTKFIDYLFEQINQKKIINENNQKIFYILSILFQKIKYENFEQYQLILSLLTRLISDDQDNNKKQRNKRKKDQIRKEEPISMRNLTIYYLLQSLRNLIDINQNEYLIDYIPLLLLCHSSKYTIIHQTSLYCLTSLSNDISLFLVSQSEYIIDNSLKRLQTSSYDGYLILIEFIRLGKKQVINLPIMIHVIEQLLLELSCLPPVESIQLTFEFLNVFCQQVIDIVENKTLKSTLISSQDKTLIDFTLDLQQQYNSSDLSSNQTNNEDEKNEVEEQHPWHKMLVSIVDVFQHFISNSNSHIRSYVLDAFPSLAQLLSTIDENLFLPLVHKLWPGLIHRLYDKDFNIRIRCLTTIQCLCKICSDFVDRRIRQDILPILIQQLETNRFISSSNTLEYRYMKYLLTNIGIIVNCLTINIDDIEKLVLILFQYLQIEQLAFIANEQLILLTKKYSDIIWLKLILHDENEYRKDYFNKMKVYKPEPMLTIDPKWKSNLLICLTNS